MPANFLVLDIEAVIDPTLPPYESKKEDAFQPPPYWQIVTIGVCWFIGTTIERIGIMPGDEARKLADLASFLGSKDPTIVGWNSRRYDMPVIVARSLAHGIALPWYYNTRGPRYRFDTNGHWDLSDDLSDYGAGSGTKLDVVARSIGMPGKLDVAGSDVAALHAAGKQTEIDNYCLADVMNTAAVMIRMALLRGDIQRDAYVESMGGLIQRIDSDERLAPLRAGMNRPRLLLETAPETTTGATSAAPQTTGAAQ